MSSGPFEKLHALVDALSHAPGIVQYRRKGAYHRFVHNHDHRQLFDGVYASYEEALANAPTVKPTGYDNDESAQRYVKHMSANDRDYPAMFWLEKSIAEGMRSVVDLGGSVGIKFYAFSKLMTWPHDLRWLVCDVPAVAKHGRRMAAEQGVDQQLHFTDQYADMSGTDVLFASGSAQFLPKPIAEVVADLAVKPRRVLINTAAIHPERDFYTLNSIGDAFCPYRVQSVGTLRKGMEALGYRLVASWDHHEKQLNLPFEPGYSLKTYKGFCFDRNL